MALSEAPAQLVAANDREVPPHCHNMICLGGESQTDDEKPIHCRRTQRRVATWLLFAWLALSLSLAAEASERLNPPSRFSPAMGTDGAEGDTDSFRPFIPKDISPESLARKVFTANGQYRVFEAADSDLRSPVVREPPHRAVHFAGKNSTGRLAATIDATVNANELTAMPEKKVKNKEPLEGGDKSLEELLGDYVQHFFGEGLFEPSAQLVDVLHQQAQQNQSVAEGARKRELRETGPHKKASVENTAPRASATGRLLFFSGLKKLMWPLYMGLQILKSLLFAMFLPTLIGSVGKLLGKGIISGSSPLFIRPPDEAQDLDFKDAQFNFDDDGKFEMSLDGPSKEPSYSYQPAASQLQQQYAYHAAGANTDALSRYGMTEQQKMQDSYLTALQSLSSASFKNSNSISAGSSGGLGGAGGGALRQKPASAAAQNTFQFQKVPTSSLLLSNYDPFYSPLLSRLDSVFAQLKLNSQNEVCREKLICLMYANPAKYAPYSNLVSAQLSRELNELRKPTSDNPDILRFFKYMRAAKDGQDGVDCEKSFDQCKEFKDFENPAMVSTYHDINKLVQARKMSSR